MARQLGCVIVLIDCPDNDMIDRRRLAKGAVVALLASTLFLFVPLGPLVLLLFFRDYVAAALGGFVALKGARCIFLAQLVLAAIINHLIIVGIAVLEIALTSGGVDGHAAWLLLTPSILVTGLVAGGVARLWDYGWPPGRQIQRVHRSPNSDGGEVGPLPATSLPKVDEPILRRRWRVRLLLLVAAGVLVGVAGVVLYTQTLGIWSRLEAAASRFPDPVGFERIGSVREGTSWCVISCDEARIIVIYSTRLEPDLACSRLRDQIDLHIAPTEDAEYLAWCGFAAPLRTVGSSAFVQLGAI